MSMADTLAIVIALAANGGTRNQGVDLPPAAAEVTIENQNGGNVSLHASRVIDYGDSGSHIRVMGSCISACTLVLALPRDRICVGPNASFGFHQPFYSNARTVATTDLGTAMEDTYPPFVRQWLKVNFGGLPSGRPQFMRYDILKRYYPTCG
ncbi:hypothetical protein [Lichenibacterium ramalinae]|uniref:Uncharacterized protein n=1 Tax=Lichenibacterium ramalinae TaxID=2316527 RepID=A0A4Q2RC88_9HYPH|nr:hypothetical protein [Lichenibacterium ramalinae]RYB03387.1 hypothetical protein D3272_16615 [Lichenibacterium ramalinae]